MRHKTIYIHSFILCDIMILWKCLMIKLEVHFWYRVVDWLIDWGLTPFLTISQSYLGGQFTYSCVSWFSQTSTPHNNLPKQLAAFPYRLRPLVEDKWRMSQWLLSNIGKKVGRAGIQTHNPWIDSPHFIQGRKHCAKKREIDCNICFENIPISCNIVKSYLLKRRHKWFVSGKGYIFPKHLN